MTGPPNRRRPRPGNIAIGVLLLARGRAEGLEQFGYTPQAFLSSLAPLVAFPLVGYLLVAVGGGSPQGGGQLGALADLLATLCALLAPPVLSFELAARWRRQALWLRYATALNWTQWAVPLLASALLLLAYPLLAAALSARVALGIVGLAIAFYALWLHWFIARHGLSLSPGRAAVLVLIVNLVTGVLVLGPRLLALAPPVQALTQGLGAGRLG
ncbi:MAG: hypothetical protein KGL52_15230 [Rhodospirillales bacterium]|nr:hypothetical protein [Rhodospirillales bacterium]